MKANELMIGDKVVVKVLSQLPSTYVLHTWTTNDYSRDIQVKPIPLTPEILEKNGWKETEYWHEYKDGNTIIQYSLSNIWGIINEIEIEHFKCEYVHQYQHLLRLCGLDELADNLKIYEKKKSYYQSN